MDMLRIRRNALTNRNLIFIIKFGPSRFDFPNIDLYSLKRTKNRVVKLQTEKYSVKNL